MVKDRPTRICRPEPADTMRNVNRAIGRSLLWLIWTGASALFLVFFLWSVLPGAIARALPTSWYYPE